MGTPQRTRIPILHSIKMRSVAFAALALALALAVGGASADGHLGMPGGFEECPHKDKDINIVVANTYNSQEEKPKCGTHNGPVDPNTLDTQNIVDCHQQIVAGTNYNLVLNAMNGVLFCDVFEPLPSSNESPEYKCSLHKHAKNKYPCVGPGTCSKHCLHHGCKQSRQKIYLSVRVTANAGLVQHESY